MVLCTADPGVVGELVVIPACDHRVRLVQALQVGVEAVAGVAQPVVGERNDLVRGLQQASGQDISGVGVGADRVFVEIVADMHHEFEVAALAGVRVGVEPAEAEVRTGEEADAEAADIPLGQGARAADRADRAIGGDESVKEPAAGREAFDDDARRVVTLRIGKGVAASDDAREHRIGRHLDPQPCAGVRCVSRPEQHAACARLTARDAVGEAAGVEDGGDARDREGAEAEHGGLDQSTAVDARGHGVSLGRWAAMDGGLAGRRKFRPVSCAGYRSAAR